MAIAAPTGTRMLTLSEREGMAIKRMSMNRIGATAIFQFFEIKTTPRAPKRAGRILAKAGASSAVRIGCSWASRQHPRR